DEPLLQRRDPVLQERLVVLRVVVLGVLGDVAELARDADPVGDLAPLLGPQVLELLCELRIPVPGKDDFLQDRLLLQRLRRRRAKRAGMVAQAGVSPQARAGLAFGPKCRRNQGSSATFATRGASATSRSRRGSCWRRWRASASRRSGGRAA